MNVKIADLPAWLWGAVGLGTLVFLLRPREVTSKGIQVVGDVVAGAAEGTGQVFQNVTEAVFGIPKTDKAKCADAMARGDTMGKLTYCALIDDLIFGKTKPAAKTPPIKPASKASTAPGGGLIDMSEPSVMDILTDPYGLGTGTFNYYMLDLTDQSSREKISRQIDKPTEILTVAGIRG